MARTPDVGGCQPPNLGGCIQPYDMSWTPYLDTVRQTQSLPVAGVRPLRSGGCRPVQVSTWTLPALLRHALGQPRASGGPAYDVSEHHEVPDIHCSLPCPLQAYMPDPSSHEHVVVQYGFVQLEKSGSPGRQRQPASLRLDRGRGAQAAGTH